MVQQRSGKIKISGPSRAAGTGRIFQDPLLSSACAKEKLGKSSWPRNLLHIFYIRQCHPYMLQKKKNRKFYLGLKVQKNLAFFSRVDNLGKRAYPYPIPKSKSAGFDQLMREDAMPCAFGLCTEPGTQSLCFWHAIVRWLCHSWHRWKRGGLFFSCSFKKTKKKE